MNGHVVEIAGPPGAGKTTVLPLIVDALRAEGFATRTPTEVARDLAARGTLGRLLAWVPRPLRGRLLWRVYLVEATAVGWWRTVRVPHLRRLISAQRLRPAEALVSERRVVRYFIRHLGTVLLFSRRRRGSEVLVVDEGFVHRVTQLLVSPVEAPEVEAISRYLAAVPPPALTVVVTADTETCLARVQSRGVWDRMSSLAEPELFTFIDNAVVASEEAKTIARDLGMTVIAIPNVEEVPPQAQSVTQAVSNAGIRSAAPLRLRWTPLRPGTIRHLMTTRRTREAVDAIQLAGVLERAGLEASGSPRVLSGGRRSAMVAIETSRGSMVVKRYPDHWPVESIHHEHDVLAELADRGFPAVHSVSNAAGTRLFSVDGSNHSIYRFVHGRSYSGRYLTPAMIEELLTSLGGLLADLHASLRGVQIDHRHHLGLDPGSRQPLRGLDWYLERVEGFRSHEVEDAATDIGWIESHLQDAERRIVATHRRLQLLDLPATIVHGDFGPHNVLFADGGPVVHDLELARLDWCLTDLAIVLVRLKTDVARRAFVAGYRDRAGDVPELRHLGVVVEWHLLAGAVYAWDRFVSRKDTDRLAVARRRLELIQSGLPERAVSWT